MGKLVGATCILVALATSARADVSLDSMSGADADKELQQPVTAPPPESPPVDAFVVTLRPSPELSREEQLLLDRCAACHPASNYQDKRYSKLRWWLVLLRMEMVNGAVLSGSEAEIIIAKLTRDRPAEAADLVAEAAVAFGLAGLFAAVAYWLRRRLIANNPPRPLV